jgi:hypothetical protein
MTQRLMDLAIFVAGMATLHVGCDKADPNHGTEKQQDQAVKTDIVVLGRFINFPVTHSQVKWTTSTRPGGNDWSLRALLFFKPEDARTLLELAQHMPGSRNTVPRDDLKDWFPPSVQVEYKSELEKSGEHVAVKATRISGSLFAAPNKSPAIHGDALVFEEQGLVYLVLFTM